MMLHIALLDIRPEKKANITPGTKKRRPEPLTFDPQTPPQKKGKKKNKKRNKEKNKKKEKQNRKAKRKRLEKEAKDQSEESEEPLDHNKYKGRASHLQPPPSPGKPGREPPPMPLLDKEKKHVKVALKERQREEAEERGEFEKARQKGLNELLREEERQRELRQWKEMRDQQDREAREFAAAIERKRQEEEGTKNSPSTFPIGDAAGQSPRIQHDVDPSESAQQGATHPVTTTMNYGMYQQVDPFGHDSYSSSSSRTIFGDFQYFGHMFVAAVIDHLDNHYQEIILWIIIICSVKYYLKKLTLMIKRLEYFQKRDRWIRARNARLFRIHSFIDFSEV